MSDITKTLTVTYTDGSVEELKIRDYYYQREMMEAILEDGSKTLIPLMGVQELAIK